VSNWIIESEILAKRQKQLRAVNEKSNSKTNSEAWTINPSGHFLDHAGSRAKW
jgi:hypothetical protein